MAAQPWSCYSTVCLERQCYSHLLMNVSGCSLPEKCEFKGQIITTKDRERGRAGLVRNIAFLRGFFLLLKGTKAT